MISIREDINNEYIKLYGINTPGAKVIMYNDLIVGMIDYDEYDNCVKIHYITVQDEYRRCGIARKVITDIINKNGGKYLYGDSLPAAIKFWTSLGAEFDEDPDEDYLTPFHINC